MTTLIFITILMMPIYLGWVFCLLAPILFPSLVMAVATCHRALSYSRQLKVVQRHDKTMVSAPIEDDRTPIVSFGEFFPTLLLNKEYTDDGPIRGRVAIGYRLIAAQDFLPDGFKLRINECFRPSAAEARVRKTISGKIATSLNDHILYKEIQVQPAVSDSSQNTGGSCDVTLVNMAGKEVDLGLKTLESLDWLGRMSPSIESSEVLANRDILATALGLAGFVNCPLEWWRWSYGDRYWSVVTNAKAAIYGAQPRAI